MGRLTVAEIWRYPVKSLAGERLDAAALTATGLPGDRLVQVRDARDRVITSRTHPRLLALHATLADDGEPVIDGLPWSSVGALARVRAAAGPDVRLVRDETLDRFDVLPLSVLTDGAVRALGVDARRLRPNLIVGGAEGLEERTWPGRRLRIGESLIAVKKLRGRCVMTTYDPDTQEQDLSVLERIVAEFGGRVALDCSVIESGRVAPGDPVEIL